MERDGEKLHLISLGLQIKECAMELRNKNLSPNLSKIFVRNFSLFPLSYHTQKLHLENISERELYFSSEKNLTSNHEYPRRNYICTESIFLDIQFLQS